MTGGPMSLRCISIPHLVAEAGGDPWALDASLQIGRPAQIDALARAFHDAGRYTKEGSTAFDEALRRFKGAWNGERGVHPINDSAQVQRAARDLGHQCLKLTKIAAELEGVAAALAEAQRTSTASITALESHLLQLDDEIGAILTREISESLSGADHSELDAILSVLERDAVEWTSRTLSQLRAILSRYTECLNTSRTALGTDGYDPTEIRDTTPQSGSSQPVQVPPPTTAPEGVNRWWKSLSQEEKLCLLAEHPPELGNLNGIPVEVRSSVNQAVMNADLDRVEDSAAENGVTADDVAHSASDYGFTTTAITRYTNARRIREGLAISATAVDGRRNHPGVFLLRYQPEAFGGEGAAAIALGNPDTAANTAFLVPGLGSNVRDGTLTDLDGVRLYGESARTDWNTTTSVVMWMGYDAPDSWHDPGLWAPNMARAGGQALASDVNALAVTHVGTPTHMTVVGHSYGSTTVADAASAFGMHADNVVLVGSPGTDLAHSAADFHLRAGGHLYVGAASTDAVTWSPGRISGPGLIGPTLAGLGADPSVDGYGSTRFKAEVPDASINPFHDHLHYFDDGSESLFSIADVVSGHGDALEHDGMTARHRGEYGLGEWIDPEALRTATTGRRHRDPER